MEWIKQKAFHMEDSSWVQMFDIQDIQEMKVYLKMVKMLIYFLHGFLPAFELYCLLPSGVWIYHTHYVHYHLLFYLSFSSDMLWIAVIEEEEAYHVY